jgi:hypothetical protein
MSTAKYFVQSFQKKGYKGSALNFLKLEKPHCIIMHSRGSGTSVTNEKATIIFEYHHSDLP